MKNGKPLQALADLVADKRVALVGNAESILACDRGYEIDTHYDIVIRMNGGLPRIVGNERAIGRRTDVWACAIPFGPPPPETKFVVFMKLTEKGDRDWPVVLEACERRECLAERWPESYEAMARSYVGADPGTGIRLLWWLRHHARPLSVAVFGMDCWRTRSHWSKRGNTPNHDPGLELLALQRLMGRLPVCAVTCTGGRPELFELTKRWVGHQSRVPDCHVVATDTGELPDLGDNCIHVAVPPIAGNANGAKRAAHALRSALAAVPDGHVAVIFEDDDYYCTDHVERILARLRTAPVACGDTVVRFHLPTARWSGYSPGAVDALPGTVGLLHESIGMYADSLDMDSVWSPPEGFYPGFTVVQIKGVGYGLPGRSGATTKHRPDHYKTMRMLSDPDHAVFRRLLGKDADHYLRLLVAS